MATKVHMEALSPTMEEGQVIKWLKTEGDSVANGEVLAEIETDKATMELVARGEGLLLKILLGEGGTAPVGSVIGVIGTDSEDIAEIVSAAGGGATVGAAPEAEGKVDSTASGSPAEVGGAAAEVAGVETGAVETVDTSGRIKASPLARRMAAEAGIQLSAVQGSGPGGRVVKRDVEAAAVSGPSVAPSMAPSVAPFPTETSFEMAGPEFEDIPLSQMRKTIAKRLVESIGPVPHFFLTIDVDMTRTMEARKRINEILAAHGEKISLNDMILRATAAALRQHPNCNAHWMGDSVRRFNAVHIGIAVAIDDGLITPVIRNAHAKGVVQISREVKELAGRAKEKKLQPDEYTGSTFSISNLGMFGIHEFTAVINPPEAGILAIGGIVDTPVIDDEGELAVEPRMRITMSCDHRVIDGAQGSRFLATLRQMLEEPAVVLM